VCEVPRAGNRERVKKTLGPLTLFALGVNGIVGVGIFVAPPVVASAVPGGAGALLYLLIAGGCLPIALAYARLSRAMPVDGGPCLFAERAFGVRASQAIGALIWVSSLFSTAAVTRALADLASSALHRDAWSPYLAVSMVLALAAVNARGLRLSALAWTALTALKLAPLIAIAAMGVFAQKSSAPLVTVKSAIGPAALGILFSLQGFEIISLPAGQAKDAERTVPRATVASLVVAALLYALVHLACVRALPGLASSKAAIPEAAGALGGSKLARAVGLGVAASISGIVVGMHAMTPRYLAAISKGLSALRTIVVSAVVVCVLVASSKLQRLVNLSSVAVLAQYAVTAVALFTLARRREEGLSLRDAWPVPFALAVVAVLLSQTSRNELAIAALVSAAGALFALRSGPRS